MSLIENKIPEDIFRQIRFQVNARHNIYKNTTISEALRYDPLQLIQVQVDNITKMMIQGRELYQKYPPGSVVGGDWDLESKPFADSIYYRSLKMRFVDESPWEETPLYKSAVNRNPGNHYHGCETKEDVLNRLSDLESIYHSISQNGYLTQRELNRSNKDLHPENHRGFNLPEKEEVLINIGRDGDLIMDNGRHRLAMVKLLDIDEIPVLVVGRHRRWWEQGNRVADIEGNG